MVLNVPTIMVAVLDVLAANMWHTPAAGIGFLYWEIAYWLRRLQVASAQHLSSPRVHGNGEKDAGLGRGGWCLNPSRYCKDLAFEPALNAAPYSDNL